MAKTSRAAGRTTFWLTSEQEPLRTLGSGIADRFKDPFNPQRQEAFLKLVGTPVSVFNCPSKRPLELWPIDDDPLNPYLANNAYSCRYSNGCRVIAAITVSTAAT